MNHPPSNKTLIMRTFNQQFMDLLADIQRIFPHNNEIAIAIMNLELIKKAKPALIVHIWYKYIYSKYKPIIDAGDITFFFEKNYAEDLTKMANAENIMRMINKIRDPVREMDDVNRGHTMKYLQILSKLSEVYSHAV
jgi:hypothetical protein